MFILAKLERWPLLVLTAVMLLSVPIVPLELWLIKTLVDHIQNWASTVSIAPIVTAAAWLAALMVLNNIVVGVPAPMAMTRLDELSTLEGQRLILHQTSRLPQSMVESPHCKDLRERALNVSLYQICMTNIQILQNFLHAAVLTVIMLAFGQWIPVIVVCLAALLQSALSRKAAGKLEQTDRSQTQDRRLLRYYADLMTKRNASKEIRLFGIGDLLAERWTSLYHRHSGENWKVARYAEMLKIGPELLMSLLSGLLIALLVLLPGAGTWSAGDFTLLLMALTMLLSQLSSLVGQFAIARTQFMRWEDFRAYLDLDEDPAWALTRTSATHANYAPSAMDLHVRHVRFRYPHADRDALSDIHFTIPAGCRAALVGENGSGKSTLIKLLTGLYTPDQGNIDWIDSGDAHDTHADRHDTHADRPARDRISAVFQDFTRLYLTLRENVALGQLAAMDQDQVLSGALRKSGSKLYDLDAQLGVPFGGTEPSGGEWQKIATSRALLRDASFIFFDEPTAALDPQAEKEAFELFLRLTQGRSALLVTHRLGAAKRADVIFVLDRGKLVEKGTHDELMQRGGEYCRLFHIQASWYV